MPARDTRRVTVVFGSETSGAEAGFRRVADRADDLQGRTGKLSQMFDKLGPGILAAVGAETIGVAFSKVIQGASDLNETVSKTQQVFKSSGADVLRWAEDASTSLGMSKRAALEGASAFGNMFSQLGIAEQTAQKMSLSMVQLSSDFASFHNANPADVMNALQAATRGEYDALQRFVPTANAAAVQSAALAETGKKTAASLTQAEKATALYNLVVENAGVATGDFQRTADSAANQQRILAANLEDTAAKIGQTVLPAYQSILGIVNDVGPLKLAILGLATAFGGRLSTALASARTAASTYTANLRAAAQAQTGAAASSTLFGRSLETVRGGAAAAATGVRDLWNNTGGFTRVAAGLTALNLAAGQMSSSASPQIQGLAVQLEEFGKTGELSGDAARTLGKDMSKFADDLGSLDSGGFAKFANGFAGTMETISGAGGVMDGSLQHAKERISGLDAALSQMVQGGHADEAKLAFERLSKVAKEQGISIDELTAGLPQFTSALEIAAKAEKDTASGADSFQKQLDILAPALKGTATDSKGFTDALAKVGTVGESAQSKLLEYAGIVQGVTSSQLSGADQAKIFSESLTGIESVAAPLAEKGAVLASVFSTIGNSALNAKQKGDSLKATLDALYGAQIAQNEAEEAAIASRDSFSETLRKNGQQFDLTTAKTEANRVRVLANRDALEAALLSARDKYVADIAAGDSADVARGKYDRQTTAILGQIKPTQRNSGAVKDLVKQYGEIPPTRTTKINVDGDTAATIALLKSFALQKALAAGNWTKAQTDAYYTTLYGTYIGGRSGNMNPRVNPDLSVTGKAAGGIVNGWSPHKRADNILTRLTAREFVQPVDSVDYYGVRNMEALRSRQISREALDALRQGVVPFADGGLAGGSVWPFTVKETIKNPANLSDLQSKFNAMLAGGILGGQSGAGGWQWQVAVMRKMFPGIGVYSTFRPGSRTLSGNMSYHSRGRAVDFQPLRKAAEWIAATYGKNTKELITPWRDLMVHNGSKHKYSHAVEAQHGVFGNNAHIHWAYDQGGILPPGTTVAHNNTRKNEYVLTEDQMRGPTINVNVVVQGNVTAEKDLARSIATEVRDELLRKANRNGGKTGL